MKRLAVLPLAALVLMGARVPATGHIEVATPVPTYQQWIDFDWSVTGKLKGYEYPMVIVDCYQDDVLVYRQLDHPDSQQLILGGGWSLWVERGGGDAECVGRLMVYPGLHDGPIWELDRTAFHAEG